MATRQVMEIPEKQVKKQTSVYSKEFIDSKLDILLGLIANRLPIIGMTIVEKLLNTPQFREILRERLVEYYQSMHQWVFSELKNVIRAEMSPEEHDFSYETIRALIVKLENEYGQSLPELQIEPESVISAFAKNQALWYQKNYSWKVA